MKLTLLFVVAGATMAAHDMWIEPSSFVPGPGEIVGVRLLVGQELLGDPLPRSSALIEQFVVVDGAGSKPVIGREGGNPAGLLRASPPGVQVVGYRSRPSAVEQTAEKFARYLEEEGLDGIGAKIAGRPSPATPVRELFSRCAKSLVLAGSAVGEGSGGDRRLGFTVELVAERNPYALPAGGGELPVRLTYEGKPLRGALVVAMNKMNPTQKLSARTDAAGRVRFNLRRAACG